MDTIKHYKTKLISFLFFVLTANISAQTAYLRVSERDCINCLLNIRNFINHYDFKLLFPENYQGKKFANLNKLYFNNEIDENMVVYSDELHEKSAPLLNGLSGFFTLFEEEIFFTLQGASFNIAELESFFKKSQSLKMITDLTEFGVSDRNDFLADYYRNEMILMDYLFKTMYIVRDTVSKKIDFNEINIEEVINQVFNKEEIASFKENVADLKQIGKNTIEIVNADYLDGKYFIGFFVPKVFKEITTGENNQELTRVNIYNSYNFFIVDRDELLSEDFNLLNNIYTFQDNDDEKIMTGFHNLYLDHKIYKINNLIYSEEDLENNKDYDLFSVYSIENNRIQFEEYDDRIKLFDFQKDTHFNNHQFFYSLSFTSLTNGIIMLKEFPYVVDVKNGTKHKLEWDSSANTYSFPPNIKLTNLQFWKHNDQYLTLFKDNDTYYIKEYDSDWKLQASNKINFPESKIKNMRFTDAYVYIITDKDQVLRYDR